MSHCCVLGVVFVGQRFLESRKFSPFVDNGAHLLFVTPVTNMKKLRNQEGTNTFSQHCR